LPLQREFSATLMRLSRSLGALALLTALCSACAPLRLTPNALAPEPQGAGFLTGFSADIAERASSVLPAAETAPAPGSGPRCGADAGERARAQCLRDGGTAGWLAD
jgi:hypothetical protein